MLPHERINGHRELTVSSRWPRWSQLQGPMITAQSRLDLVPGTVFTKGLKSRVLSLDLSHDLGQDLLSQKQNLCVGKSSQTNIITAGCLCSNILYCEHGVSFLLSPSRIHDLAHPWTPMLLLWIRDDVTIVAIDFEWKNVTQTKRRRDMRLTSPPYVAT